ncbi:MAG TPA: LLM class F420-dependent oxidoreductase [Stellaceae bacterium]|nr:LLM class F420-dependent oxidoreductase [Stellaceae bacterium]
MAAKLNAGRVMEFGAQIFFTEYSIAPARLATALEERGFDSLWVAEHSHIPAARRFTLPGNLQLTREYYDVMDPFVTLTAAAVATRRLKLATAICLVIQRDTIQTAKSVASLDRVSGGRFLFGVGVGWNAEEMEDHGTVYETRAQKMREQIAAMKLIWTRDVAEYHGAIVDFPPMIARPKPMQRPHPPIIVGGAFRHAARRAIRYGDGLLPQGPAQGSGSPAEYMPELRRMAAAAGRDPASLPVTFGNAPEDADLLKRYRDLGIARVTVRLPAEPADRILPILDRYAALKRIVDGA